MDLNKTIDLVKANSQKTPLIIVPPTAELLHIETIVLYWLVTLPTNGNLRNELIKNYNMGKALYIMTEPDLLRARGNFGQINIQINRFIGHLQVHREEFIQSKGGVYSYDKNKQLVTQSSFVANQVKCIGLFGAIMRNALEFRQEALGKDPNDPSPSPIPLPTTLNGKQDGTKYYNDQITYITVKFKDGKMDEGLVQLFIDDMIKMASSGIYTNQLIQPPTDESRYYVEFYQTVLGLFRDNRWDIIPNITDEISRSEFWDKYKWWIIGGGGLGLLTIFGIYKSL